MTDPEIPDRAFRSAARAMLRPALDTDGFEVDEEDDTVSRNEAEGTSDGAYVKVWIWVENEDAKKAWTP